VPVLDYRRQAVGTLRVGLSGAYVIRHLTAGVSAVEQNCTNVRIVDQCPGYITHSGKIIPDL